MKTTVMDRLNNEIGIVTPHNTICKTLTLYCPSRWSSRNATLHVHAMNLGALLKPLCDLAQQESVSKR